MRFWFWALNFLLMNFVVSLSKISVGIRVSNVAVIWPFYKHFDLLKIHVESLCVSNLVLSNVLFSTRLLTQQRVMWNLRNFKMLVKKSNSNSTWNTNGNRNFWRDLPRNSLIGSEWRGFLSSANNLLWSTTKSQNIKDKGDKNYMHI